MIIVLICYSLISYFMSARSFKSYDGPHTVSIGMNSRSLDKLPELLLVRIVQKSCPGGSTTHTILVTIRLILYYIYHISYNTTNHTEITLDRPNRVGPARTRSQFPGPVMQLAGSRCFQSLYCLPLGDLGVVGIPAGSWLAGFLGPNFGCCLLYTSPSPRDA